MPHLKRIIAVALAALAIHGSASDALALTFEDGLRQGNLIIGQVAPGSQISIEGNATQVMDDGRFVFGISKEAKNLRIAVIAPDGTVESHLLPVLAELYDSQRFDRGPLSDEQARVLATRLRETPEPHFLDGFIWPVTGRFTGAFGLARTIGGRQYGPHGGLDLAVPSGTPVKAAGAGTVSFTHGGLPLGGKTVMIDHGQGVVSSYLHLSHISVRSGQSVDKGQIIGAVGSTGRSTGPHLHLGFSWKKVRLDPILILSGPLGRGLR